MSRDINLEAQSPPQKRLPGVIFRKNYCKETNEKGNTIFSTFEDRKLSILGAEMELFLVKIRRLEYDRLEKVEYAKTLKNHCFFDDFEGSRTS